MVTVLSFSVSPYSSTTTSQLSGEANNNDCHIKVLLVKHSHSRIPVHVTFTHRIPKCIQSLPYSSFGDGIPKSSGLPRQFRNMEKVPKTLRCPVNSSTPTFHQLKTESSCSPGLTSSVIVRLTFFPIGHFPD